MCAIHFEAGSIYHYQYVTDLSMNKAQTQSHDTVKRPVGLRVTADLKLSVVWKKSYDYLMRLEVSTGINAGIQYVPARAEYDIY